MVSKNLDQFSERLSELIPRLMRECTRHESNYLSEGVITLQQYVALEHLRQMGLSKMSRLAEAMCLQMSSLTGLTDRLVKHGLVKRERCEQDRRSVYVDLTPKGKKILKEIQQQKRKGIESLFSRLTIKERSQYLDIIEKLVGDLSAHK